MTPSEVQKYAHNVNITMMGDVMTELRNLAVPFTLMLVANGMKHIKQRSNASGSKKKSPKKKQSGGGCGCASIASSKPKLGGSACGMPPMPPSQAGGKPRKTRQFRGGSTAVSSELSQLSSKLNAMIDSYMI